MPSLKGVEAWNMTDLLPPGSYTAKAATVERTTSSGNNPQVQIDWRVMVGEFTGAEQRDWVTLTDLAMGRVVMLLEAAAVEIPDSDFKDYEEMADWLAKQVVNVVVEMVVRLRDDRQGRKDERTGEVKQWPEVAGYRRPSVSDVPSNGFAGQPQVKDADLPF